MRARWPLPGVRASCGDALSCVRGEGCPRGNAAIKKRAVFGEEWGPAKADSGWTDRCASKNSAILLTSQSPRDEIRPVFATGPHSGPDCQAALVIRTGGREGLDGRWVKSFPVPPS